MFRYVLFAYMLIMPCVYGGPDLRVIQETFFQIGSMMIVFSAFFGEVKTKTIDGKKMSYLACNILPRYAKENKWLAMFGIWSLLNFFYYRFQVGSATIFNIFLGLALYFICYLCIKKEDIPKIFKCIIIVCVLNIIYLIGQFNGFDPIYFMRGVGPGHYDTSGLFGIKALLGVYFAISIPLMAYFNPMLPIIGLWPLYVSVSSSASGGGVIGWLVYMWYFSREKCAGTFKKASFYIMAVILLLGATTYIIKVDNPMGMQTSRLTMWGQTLKMSLRKPISGWGLDSFRSTYEGKNFLFMRVEGKDNKVVSGENVKAVIESKKHLDLWDNAHLEPLQLLFEFGFIGFGLMAIFVFMLFRRFLRAKKSRELVAVASSLLVLLLCSTTQFPFHVSRIAHLIPVLLGCFMVLSEDSNAVTNRK